MELSVSEGGERREREGRERGEGGERKGREREGGGSERKERREKGVISFLCGLDWVYSTNAKH